MLSKINFLMNKIYLFTAAFAVMASLSGCSDTELASIDTAQEKTPIGFHTVGSQMGSRATIINNENITSTDFKVYAFDKDGNAFMGYKDTELGWNGFEINHKTGEWDYANSSDLRYWPDYSLDFYAVSPEPSEEDKLSMFYSWNINKDKQTIYYSTFDEYAPNITGQNLDVMYAVAKGQTKSSGKVKLSFKHILSQIAFQAKTNNPKLVVEINEIKLFNMKYSGYFDFPTDNTAPTRKNWRPNDLGSSHACTVITGANIKVNSTTDVADISSKNKPMLVIPQQLTAWNTNKTTAKPKEDADKDKEGYLGISCKIKVNGVSYKTGDEDKNPDGYGYIWVPFGDTWEPGKRYVYTLIFGGGYNDQGKPILTPINFTANTEEWKDGDNSTTGNEIVTQQ